MAFWRREKKSAPSPSEADNVAAIMGLTGDTSIGSAYTGQLNNGYKKNPYVAKCVDLRAGVLAGLSPLLLDKDGNEIEQEKHPLRKVLEFPNPRQSWHDLMFDIEAHLQINGNAFIEVVKTVKGPQIFAIPPNLVTAVVDTNNYRAPIKSWTINGAERKLEDIIHLHGVTGEDGLGISPLEPAGLSITSQTEARKWNTELMKNGAKPSMTVSVPEVLTDVSFNRFKERMTQAYQGDGNRGKVLVLDGGKTVTYDGFNARDMDYTQGVTVAAREIAMALSVPPELVGDSANKTYANAEEANREFALHCIVPQADMIYTALSRAICPAYPDVDRIGYDRSEIDGLQGNDATLLAALTGCDFLTDNEKRARLSYAPIPDGDTILVPMGKVPRTDLMDEPDIDES